MKSNVPYAPQQYFDDAGVPSAGGYIQVYLRGTTTPATSNIFWDLDGNMPGSNPVVLDAAGKPYPTGQWFLDAGAYTLYLYDANDVQIGDPVDIMIGGNLFGGNETITEASGIMVATYNDLRGLVAAWDAVYVCGRSAEGDGGQGWFQLCPNETGSDDDGVCLIAVAGSRRYVRVYDAEINPLWYGLVYAASVDQTSNLVKCLTGSNRWNSMLGLKGTVYLTQNVSIGSGSSIKAHLGGKFVAADIVPSTMTFAAGSRLECFGETFSTGVTAKFAEGVVPAVRSSWYGGLADTVVTRLAGCASGSAKLTAILDTVLSVGAAVTFGAAVALDVDGGRFQVNSTLVNVSIAVLAYEGVAPWLTYGNATYVGTIYLGGRACVLEWFGATADGTADDSIPWTAGVHHGTVQLLGKYKVTSALTINSVLSLNGSLSSAPGYLVASAATMPTPSVIFSGAGTRLTLPANSILACAGVGLAFDQATGQIDGNLSTAKIFLDNVVVYSAATTRILNASQFAATNCSMTSKELPGFPGSSTYYANCTFGMGGVGYTTHQRIQSVLELDYITPPASGPNPPLVCRQTDKTVQLGNAAVAVLLSGGLSFGPGTVVTSNYQYIGPTDPPVTYVTSTGNTAIDLPTASEMASEPEASLIRIIVLCRRGLGTDNQVWISNASQSCWYGQAGGDPDSSRYVRIPAPTTYRMGMILYFINGYWAQLG